MSIIAPYKGQFRVSQEYKGSAHQGVDLVGVTSKDLYATTNGTVEIASNADPNGFGIYVRIKSSENGWIYYYGHMSSVCVRVGQKVKKGDKIGVEGSTGHSTGSHCHYEVRKIAGSKSSFTDINALSGIPNKIGTCNSELFGSLSNNTEEKIKIFRVQVGAFSKEENAKNMLDKLKKNGFDGYIVNTTVNGKPIRRVQIGAFSKEENAKNMLDNVKKSGYSEAYIISSFVDKK